MLTGTAVALRAIEESDLPNLLSWRNMPSLRRYFREYRELNSTQQKDWFDNKVNGDPDTRMFAIVDRFTAQLLGACGLCYIDWVNRSADFSIYIGHEQIYIDDILAPDAARTLMSYAYSELNMHRLWAEIYDFDEKKIKFFNSLNFKLDGKHRDTHWHLGSWHSSLFYSHLQTD